MSLPRSLDHNKPGNATSGPVMLGQENTAYVWAAFAIAVIALIIFGITNLINAIVALRDSRDRRQDLRLRQEWASREATHVQSCESFQRRATTSQEKFEGKITTAQSALRAEAEQFRASLEEKMTTAQSALRAEAEQFRTSFEEKMTKATGDTFLLRAAAQRETERREDADKRMRDLELRLRNAELNLARKDGELAEFKRRFNKKFD